MENVIDISNQLLGLVGTPKSIVNLWKKRTANLTAFADIYNRVTSAQDVMYDIFEGDNDYSAGKMDTTKTRLNAGVSAGVTDLTALVESSVGFQKGQEITIQDDVNKENVIINRANESVNTLFDRTTPSSVVASANTTDAHARPQVLSNGWIVTAEINGTTDVRFQVSKDNGLTFNPLCYWTMDVSSIGLCSFGTTLYLIGTKSASSIAYFLKFDATTVTNTGQSNTNTLTGQTSFGAGCSITVDTTGKLTISACSKNATYTNSNNIISQKSVDGGVTWTKQDGTAGVDQITSYNTAGYDHSTPYVQYDKNNIPIIFYQACLNLNYYIYNSRFSNNLWGQYLTYNAVGNYNQSNPTATLLTSGRIVCTWQGLDSTDTTYYNIRCMYSDDNGVTWVNFGVSTMKITSGNTYNQMYPSVTSDKNSNISILWSSSSAISGTYFRIRQIIWNGTWGAITDLTTNTTANMNYPSSCDNYKDFTSPITIWQDNVSTRVAFYGKYNYPITTSYLQVSALAHAYKQYARVYRSLPDIDTVNKRLKFSRGFDSYIQSDRTTPVGVVASANTTNAHARPQVLSNGWIVLSAYSAGHNYMYVSKDNGISFNQLCDVWTGAVGVGLTSYGTIVYVLANDGATLGVVKFDALTVTNTDKWATKVNLETGMSGYSGIHIAINSVGTALTASWACKTATYPNSINIRSAKSVDGGVTWTKQDGTTGIDQITTGNTTGNDMSSPYVQYDRNNSPIIIGISLGNSNYNVYCWTWSGSSWVNRNIYTGSTYAQSNPIATLLTSGRIVCTWYGKDATDTTMNNIRCMYSDDNGATWNNFGVSTMKITSGNTYGQDSPSVTSDKLGNVYIMWEGITSASGTGFRIRTISWNGSWSAITDLTTNTATDIQSPSTCDNYKDFTNPISIWQENASTRVAFYGKWNIIIPVPLLSEDIRYNIVPKTGTAYSLISWVEYETDAGLTLSAMFSDVGLTDDESFTAMTKTGSIATDGTHIEDEFVSSKSVNSKLTEKINMSRNINTLDKAITHVLGAVA